MAITGTGTKDNPYIVHSYDEIKDVFQNKVTSDYLYAKLANDIDCNEYGDTWEWETINVRVNKNFEFDLDGHTIKNIMIKKGSSLFSGAGMLNVIRNGKILNVFNNGAANIFSGVNLSNLSISINATGVTGYVFNNIGMNSCAVYVKSNKLENNCIRFNTSLIPSNNDYYFDIENLNSRILLDYNGAINDKTLQDSCRIRGTVKGNAISEGNFINSHGGINNCVIEIDNKGVIYETGKPGIPIYQYQGFTTTGIFNTEIGNYPESILDMKMCTTAQMRDPDYLNSIGFTVAKVGE